MEALRAKGFRNGAQGCIPITAVCKLHYASALGKTLLVAGEAEKRGDNRVNKILKRLGFLRTQVKVHQFCLLVHFTFKVSQSEALVQGGCVYPLL
jgi:hypothetical protein